MPRYFFDFIVTIVAHNVMGVQGGALVTVKSQLGSIGPVITEAFVLGFWAFSLGDNC